MRVERKFLKWSVIALGGLIAFGLLFIVFAVKSNVLKNVISAKAASALGRSVVILGDIHIHFSTIPRIQVERLVVGNDTEGGAPIEIGKLTFTVELAELLHGRIVLPEFDVDNPTLTLAKTHDRTAPNGHFETITATDTVKQTGTLIPVIGRIRVKNGTISYSDPQQEMNVVMTVSTALGDVPAHGEIVEIKGKGTYKRSPLRFFVHGGSILTLWRNSRPYPLEADATLGNVHAHFGGTIFEPAGKQRVDGTLTVEGDRAADLASITGISIRTEAPYKLSGHLAGDKDAWSLENFSSSIGNSDVKGHLAIHVGGKRPFVVADIQSENLDIREHPFGFDALRTLDADVTIRATRAYIPFVQLPLEHASAHLALQNSVLTIQPFDFRVADGKIHSNITLDGGRDIPTARMEIEIQGLKAEAVLALLESRKKIDGELGGKAILFGKGRSVHSMLVSADGNLTIVLANGRLNDLPVGNLELAKTFDFLLVNEDMIRALGYLVSDNSSIGIRCAIGDFILNKGVLSSRSLIADSERAIVTGDGRIDINSKTIDSTLIVYPKESEAHAGIPIRITGPMTALEIKSTPASLSNDSSGPVAHRTESELNATFASIIATSLHDHRKCQSFLTTLQSMSSQ